MTRLTMWSDQLQGRRPRKVVSSSSPSSSSSRSSPSSILQPILRRPGTMDEVWNNISHCPDRCAQPTPRALILQDFLAVPVFPNQIAAATEATPRPVDSARLPPPTILSLNPTGIDYSHASEPDTPRQPNSSSTWFRGNTWLPEKRKGATETSYTDVGGFHRQQKRMIKNRESAARSRARKQAYTRELEDEVRNLYDENTMLRGQLDEMQLKAAMAAHVQAPARKMLQRTSTAPF